MQYTSFFGILLRKRVSHPVAQSNSTINTLVIDWLCCYTRTPVSVMHTVFKTGSKTALLPQASYAYAR